jgi:glycerol-3-phosphate acyltransferase PlsY
MIAITVIAVLSYLMGSIPTSIIVARCRRGIDIRQFGSGNAGGTNAFRVLGWKAGLFVLLADIGKGLVATMLISRLMYGPIPFTNKTPFDDYTVVQIIAGVSAILGHIWTVFAGFKGGKGMATAAGMLIGVAPVETVVSFAIFSIVILVFNYVSLGSLSAAVAFPLAMFFRQNIFMAEVPGYNTLIFFSIGVSLLIIYTHRSNIKRLLKGTEQKMSTVPFLSKR